MKTVRIVGRGDLDAALASMPERVRLATSGDDADIVLATPSAFVDGAVPLLMFAPRIEDIDALLDVALVDITVERDRVDELSATVDALAVVRRLVGPLDAVRLVHRSERAVVLTTGVATISVVVSTRDALHADAVSRAVRLAIDVDAGALASPARIATFTADGEHVAPLVHQSAVRLVLARALQGEVDDISVDLGLARALL